MSRTLTLKDIEVFETTVEILCNELKSKAANLRKMLIGVSEKPAQIGVSKKRIKQMMIKRELRITNKIK